MLKPEFVYVTYIETTPEKLWHALTDGDFTERYWFGARLRSDWKVGSSFEMVRTDNHERPPDQLDNKSQDQTRRTGVSVPDKPVYTSQPVPARRHGTMRAWRGLPSGCGAR